MLPHPVVPLRGCIQRAIRGGVRKSVGVSQVVGWDSKCICTQQLDVGMSNEVFIEYHSQGASYHKVSLANGIMSDLEVFSVKT